MSSTGSRDKIEEIKDRLDIVDVIGRDITLQNDGNGVYSGSVPPVGKSGRSLKVDRNGQLWNDTKNGKGGDVLDWIGRGFGDPKGADFPEVLRIAADLAGVELEEMTEEDRDAAKEKADIHNLFTAAAEVYHNNLTPELYDFIKDKWGITRETVDLLKIGYATKGRNLNDLDKTTLKKSGLVFVNGGLLGGEVFTGRIIFPYWKNGKVVYLIGRETEETPEAEREKGMKYKKLLVHKEGREYVSPSVQNSYFYGEDSLRGSYYCVITEGVADCIAMLQAGISCISPVTVQFSKHDHPKLISLAKGLSKVFICNDNETNKAGLKGALSTAEALEGAGIEARLIELPKPEGIDKIDIADYMKDHNKDDFKKLMDSSSRLWTYKLNQQVINPGSESLERLRAFKVFISNDLHGMASGEWEIFVNNEVAKKYRLNKKDVKTTIEEVTKSRQGNNTEEKQEDSEEGRTRKGAHGANFPHSKRGFRHIQRK
ncbi:MAG: toprim domain-containing protein [Methanosarcina barkeri]|nr:toprim domain-containing protein [Methanosarcina sp. ERenArc_MAG2]MCO5381784.1 toprim domain-containing protein [Methanosarcina sp. ERenArc_MAG2]